MLYRLEEPIYFWLFAIIPILIVVFLFVLWWKKRTQKKFTNAKMLAKIAPNSSTFKSVLKLIFFLIGISFLIISLVNPKMGTKLKTVKREGVDVVFALDVSKSMLAEDIAPNRLEKAKQIISKTIDKLGSDRVGIIIYAGNAYPLLPITTDHAAAKMFLQNANPDMVSSQGTAINEALNLAKTYYNNDEQTNRFLIVISDGEDHQDQTKELAQNISKEGVKVYSIGVGTEKGAPIPIKRNGALVGYKKDHQGQTVITKRKSDVLQDIAEASQGKYIDGNKTSNPVNAIEKIITNAQKSEFETKQFSDYKDQFQWFLGIGLLFLIIDLFFFERKTKWVKKADLFNEKES
ncbi:vWA domain-containing protein [Tenacibaculum finnmarkense]|uniref:BatB protein n=1 Tax=Tenacibaculum finnmarkense genomovar ulcerans TaxID=2781388 RepID=A0A2I2M6K9_9FLAO|nr:VWA domain-containing protein [Tenacibaculum finnmarkense]ALU75972.1 BatB protein [Tenacibaculum dicentrarchi]MBE7633439.1 VWA domain-containing protein [Tenacibaculum finnmarkense genomovar ulcerans]MBE7696566.1 VWA domain-containing protein [Tenacibaculum finnmarkense genomovar ulcerans]MCD8429353.1 VWA domain-containing protein [Tenacibaculum finnmarkense genomovar ulcerans]SOU88178.1 BatB protein [Tenacibaculum finnmarkense genomovar ulcerans]